MAINDFGSFRSRMLPQWNLARALEGGSYELRRHADEYLPRFENETEKNFNRRKELATLANFYVRSRNQMVGEIFREPLGYESGTLPEQIISNLDRKGTDLQGTGEKLCELLLTRSVCGLVVDHPAEGGASFAEDLARDIRHYWTIIRPENVIDCVVTYENGREVVVQARWFEDAIVRSGEFEFLRKQRIIVLDRPLVTAEDGSVTIGKPRGRIYESTGNEDSSASNRFREHNKEESLEFSLEGDFNPVGEWTDLVGFEEIPFIPLCVNRIDVFEGRAPLADIAEKNLQHWRQSANYQNALEIGAFPLLVRYGVGKKASPTDPIDKDPLPKGVDGQSVIGPHVVMDMPSTNEGANAEYLEPTGQAYSALEAALDRMVSEAEMMSLSLIVKGFDRTATEATYDRLSTLAPLQRVAMEIEWGMNRALEMTAAARGRNEQPGEVAINKDFGVSASDAMRIQALRDARAIGDITAETYLRELKEIGALSSSLDPAVEAANARANEDGAGFGA